MFSNSDLDDLEDLEDLEDLLLNNSQINQSLAMVPTKRIYIKSQDVRVKSDEEV